MVMEQAPSLLTLETWLSTSLISSRLEITEANVPLESSDVTCVAFRADDRPVEHVALFSPNYDPLSSNPPLLRIHSECLTGDVFGSKRCDCGEQLDAAIEAILVEQGIVIYMRGHEGRGIGLFEKIRAYQRQDLFGEDTVDANLALGHPPDCRDYGDAVLLLQALGVDRVRLMTNNPTKTAALDLAGIEIDTRIPSAVEGHPARHRYMATKADRMGHWL